MMIWCLVGFPTAGFKSAEPSAVPVMSGSTSAGRLRTTIQRHKNLPLPILILASRLRHCPPVSSGGEWLWSGDLAEILVIQWHLIEESIIIWQFICEFHFLCIFRYNYSKRPGERGSRGRLQVIKSLNFKVWNLPTAAFVIPIRPSQVIRTLGLKRTICLKLVKSWTKAYMCKMRIKIPEIFLQFCVSQFLQYPTHFWTTSTENELIHRIKWADGQWLWVTWHP